MNKYLIATLQLGPRYDRILALLNESEVEYRVANSVDEGTEYLLKHREPSANREDGGFPPSKARYKTGGFELVTPDKVHFGQSQGARPDTQISHTGHEPPTLVSKEIVETAEALPSTPDSSISRWSQERPSDEEKETISSKKTGVVQQLAQGHQRLPQSQQIRQQPPMPQYGGVRRATPSHYSNVQRDSIKRNEPVTTQGTPAPIYGRFKRQTTARDLIPQQSQIGQKKIFESRFKIGGFQPVTPEPEPSNQSQWTRQEPQIPQTEHEPLSLVSKEIVDATEALLSTPNSSIERWSQERGSDEEKEQIDPMNAGIVQQLASGDHHLQRFGQQPHISQDGGSRRTTYNPAYKTGGFEPVTPYEDKKRYQSHSTEQKAPVPLTTSKTGGFGSLTPEPERFPQSQLYGFSQPLTDATPFSKESSLNPSFGRHFNPRNTMSFKSGGIEGTTPEPDENPLPHAAALDFPVSPISQDKQQLPSLVSKKETAQVIGALHSTMDSSIDRWNENLSDVSKDHLATQKTGTAQHVFWENGHLPQVQEVGSEPLSSQFGGSLRQYQGFDFTFQGITTGNEPMISQGNGAPKVYQSFKRKTTVDYSVPQQPLTEQKQTITKMPKEAAPQWGGFPPKSTPTYKTGGLEPVTSEHEKLSQSHLTGHKPLVSQPTYKTGGFEQLTTGLSSQIHSLGQDPVIHKGNEAPKVHGGFKHKATAVHRTSQQPISQNVDEAAPKLQRGGFPPRSEPLSKNCGGFQPMLSEHNGGSQLPLSGSNPPIYEKPKETTTALQWGGFPPRSTPTPKTGDADRGTIGHQKMSESQKIKLDLSLSEGNGALKKYGGFQPASSDRRSNLPPTGKKLDITKETTRLVSKAVNEVVSQSRHSSSQDSSLDRWNEGFSDNPKDFIAIKHTECMHRMYAGPPRVPQLQALHQAFKPHHLVPEESVGSKRSALQRSVSLPYLEAERPKPKPTPKPTRYYPPIAPGTFTSNLKTGGFQNVPSRTARPAEFKLIGKEPSAGTYVFGTSAVNLEDPAVQHQFAVDHRKLMARHASGVFGGWRTDISIGARMRREELSELPISLFAENSPPLADFGTVSEPPVKLEIEEGNHEDSGVEGDSGEVEQDIGAQDLEEEHEDLHLPILCSSAFFERIEDVRKNTPKTGYICDVCGKRETSCFMLKCHRLVHEPDFEE